MISTHLLLTADLLYTEDVPDDMETLPSPEQLKRRIIIKGRKAAPVQAAESESEDDDEMDSLSPGGPKRSPASSSDSEASRPTTPVLGGRLSPSASPTASRKTVRQSSSVRSKRRSRDQDQAQTARLEKVTDQSLSHLVNVCQGVHFHGFKEPGGSWRQVLEGGPAGGRSCWREVHSYAVRKLVF